MLKLHATSLGYYNQCPYKFKFDKSDVDSSKVMPGDMLNIVVTNDGDVEPFIKYYLEHYDPDFKQWEMLRKIYTNVRREKNNLKQDVIDNCDIVEPEWTIPFFQETKFYLKINDDTEIIGSPDCFYYDYKDECRVCIDWKTSANFSWYKGNAIREESFQPTVYAKMICDYFKVDRVKFQFKVFSKGNGESITVERPDELWWPYFTLEEVNKKLSEALAEYNESECMDERKPKSCRMCMFCDLKKHGECPLYQKKISSSEEL